MTIDSSLLAQQILKIIPPVMRVVAAELRQTSHLPAPSHFSALVMLHYQSCNLSELAESQGVSLPSMSSTVSRLEERGLVTRERSAHDRRVVVVSLTPAGREKLLEISLLAESRLQTILDGLTDGERESLYNGLSVLQNTFNIAIDDLTSGIQE